MGENLHPERKKIKSYPPVETTLAALGVSATLLGGANFLQHANEPELTKEEQVRASMRPSSAAEFIDVLGLLSRTNKLSEAKFGKLLSLYLHGDPESGDYKATISLKEGLQKMDAAVNAAETSGIGERMQTVLKNLHKQYAAALGPDGADKLTTFVPAEVKKTPESPQEPEHLGY